jgi:4-hydroxy-2-oxoheptanedioate aldolase
MSNNTKQQLQAGTSPVGTWISVGHPSVAEVSASLGFDFLLVDTEHTAMSLETVENMVRAVDAASDTTDVLVRMPWNDSVRIKRVLDTGVDGVMVPMVETAAEARDFVAATRYPPEGSRGIAAGRAADYGLRFEEYVQNVEGSILTIVQVETETGLANAGDIAAVDGVDALFVGPADLSGSLDVFGQWESDRFVDALAAVVDAGRDADTPVGTLTLQTDDIRVRLQQGFDFLIAGKDTATLAAANRETLEIYEQALAEHTDPAAED